MKIRVPSHLRSLADRAKAEGWTLTQSGSGHIRWQPPKGRAYFTGATPNRRGHGPENARRRIARALEADRAAR